MNAAVHIHRARVRYAETDQMGVVHHASYLLYLEDGRTRLLEERGLPYTEIEAAGLGLPVRRVDLRFREAARYGDELCVHTRLSRLRAASVAFDYEIRRGADDALLATAWLELACVDLSSPDRPVAPLPDALRECLEREPTA
ncbi:MAG: thioesterase family protein [Planctomycetota bacterium]|jgi:acyl-CoA thioester hydrolase|nr:thioesterase family protein [Planctomycetota bacterium]MDP6761614.1 thioesterase family protein [Planctomycetota bacterium]MDP6987990.1 thioesterase family protein [Planctomycetota bacterium]